LKIAVVNGPNLNWLGKREPKIYGSLSWKNIWEDLQTKAEKRDIPLIHFQSNSEGGLIDRLQELDSEVQGVLFNPGGYAHTSVALRDCVASLRIPVVEVHITKVQKREVFRHRGLTAEAADACITGFGADSYFLGLELLQTLVQLEVCDSPQ